MRRVLGHSSIVGVVNSHHARYHNGHHNGQQPPACLLAANKIPIPPQSPVESIPPEHTVQDETQPSGTMTMTWWSGMMATVTTWFSKLLDARSFPRFLYQCLICLAHFAGAFAILYVWLRVATKDAANPVMAKRLIQPSYFLTDHTTGLHLTANRGTSLTWVNYLPVSDDMNPNLYVGFTKVILNNSKYVVVPASQTLLPVDKTSILQYMQPVPLLYVGLSSSSQGEAIQWPNMCEMLNVTSASNPSTLDASAQDVAAWKACRAQDVPMALVDVPHRIGSVVPFSSNNLLFLLYVTLFLTGVLALAFVVPRDWDRQNLAVMLALLLLAINFGFVLFAPMVGSKENSNRLRVPVNNAMVAAAFHLIVAVAIVLLSRNRVGVVVAASVRRQGGGSDHKEHTGLDRFTFGNFRHLFSPRKTAAKSSWKIGNFLENSRPKTQSFLSVSQAEYAYDRLRQKQPSSRMHNRCGGTAALVSQNWTANKSSTKSSSSLVNTRTRKPETVMAIVPVTTTRMDGSKSTTAGGFQFGKKAVPSWLFDTNFIEEMENHLTWITVKYFEYALTAGLFLIGILLLFAPNADTYIYQGAFVGLFACNIIAIPLHKIMVYGCTLETYLCALEPQGAISMSKDGEKEKKEKGVYFENRDLVQETKWHVLYAGLAFFLASWMFFFAGMAFFIDLLGMYQSLEGMPDFIKAMTFITLSFFFSFALLGSVYIPWSARRMLYVQGTQCKVEVHKLQRQQNLFFEMLNNVKWILAMIAVGGGVQSIGFSL